MDIEIQVLDVSGSSGSSGRFVGASREKEVS